MNPHQVRRNSKVSLHLDPQQDFSTPCPLCGRFAHLIGKLPDECFIGGKILEKPIAGGDLWECIYCGFGFRVVKDVQSEQNTSMYIAMDETYWTNDISVRNDWKVIYSLLSKLPPPKNILDLGCWNGDFLFNLPTCCEKYGIEINNKASRLAESRGIKIISRDINNIHCEKRFDLITAIDIIEHVPDPRQLIINAKSLLTKGGHLVISTGNFYAYYRRFCRSSYWYCADIGHLCFVSEPWFRNIADTTGLHLKQVETFSHFRTSLHAQIKEFSANMLFHFYPLPLKIIRSMKLRRKNASNQLRQAYLNYPPLWTSARDHIAVVMKRSDQ